MINKLRRKFVAVAMLSILIVTSSIFSTIMLDNYFRVNTQIDQILKIIAENNGVIPDIPHINNNNFITKETKYSTRYFTVTTNNDFEIETINLDHIASISENQVTNIFNEIKNKKNTGFYENFKYLKYKTDNGYLIVFLDSYNQLKNLEQLIKKGLLIFGFGLLIVLLFLTIFSKKAMKPIVENIENQRRFITNAGHDLKTPVAIIMSDVEVLELTSEDNEWIQSIKHQALKLDSLIKGLLNLSKVEEKNMSLDFTEFSINSIINEEVNDFKALAKDKEIIFNNTFDLLITADQNSIRQVISILLDNAIKYTPDNGKIIINIKKQGKNTKINFMNECQDIENIDTKRLFERFYRNDKSRNSKKEGYGIGLSIAKSVIELNKGTLSVEITKDNMICFSIIF